MKESAGISRNDAIVSYISCGMLKTGEFYLKFWGDESNSYT